MRYPWLTPITTFAAAFAALMISAHGAAQSGEEDPAEESDAPADPADAPPPGAPPPLFEPAAPSVPFQTVPDSLPSLSAQSCNACHGDIVQAWGESGHGHAWDSELYQRALAAADEPAYCLRCHIPLLNQRVQTVQGYDEGLLSRPKLDPNPLFDPTLRSEGVTCAACHVRDGNVYGSRTLVQGEAPHPVTHNAELEDSGMCAQCHQLAWPGTEEAPLYDTWREWQASAWGTHGVGCQDCHMPLETGPVSGSRFAAHRDHRVVGPSDPAMLARAVTVLVGPVPARLQRGDELRVLVRVLNTGAGHHMPTGNPHSWVELRVRCEGVEGLEGADQSWSFRREVALDPEHEAGEDTRLPAGEEVAFEYSYTPDKKVEAPADLRLVVELAYHRLPAELVEQYELAEEDVTTVFHSQVIAIPLR
jgi:hypothetical protein